MVNVKKNNYYLIFVVLFTAIYFVFLIFNIQQQKLQQQQQLKQQQQLEQKQKQQQQLALIKKKHVDALIFGGSNALWGLSARQLSAINNKSWHNASMEQESGSKLLYDQFILKLASETNKNNIKVVVYSSILPYHSKSIKIYVEGPTNDILKIIPSQSIAAFLKGYFTNHLDEIEVQKKKLAKEKLDAKDELIFNTFGDYANPERKCFYENSRNKFDPETIENSTNFLVSRSYFLASTFPNSKIYITLPSLYYGLPTPGFLIYTAKLKESFNRNLFLMYPQLTGRVNLIVQPLYPTVEDVCSDPFHGSAIGRVWRTNDLLRSILDLQK